MRHDGVRNGYDIAHTRDASRRSACRSSRRAGLERRSISATRSQAGASGALAATIFHDRLIAIPELKEYLATMRDRNAPLTGADVATLAWAKMDGLLPAIVQDARTGADR